MEEFKKLGLSNNVIKALKKKGYLAPTDIQQKTIPILLKGKVDIIAQSQTGTGKTAGFALPIIEKCLDNSKHVQALILAPTRELALQVTSEIESLLGDKKLRVLAVYGGSSIRDQIKALKIGVDIVVGTPGRVIDLIKRKELVLSKISFAVLDEADEMLNMGFIDDIKKILTFTNDNKRMLLFSATMPKVIMNIAKKFMKEIVTFKVEKEDLTLQAIEQVYYEISGKDRFSGLRRIIDINNDIYCIIFCKTKATVDEVAHKLVNLNYNAVALHGDISQAHREKILKQFKDKNVKILVATDVAARGIHVNDLTHVINYSLPQDPESYVHRIGRTGRVGKKGIAITFLMPSEKRKLNFFEKIVGSSLIKKEFPSVDEIIEIKQNNIKNKIEKIINSDYNKKFEKLAKEILITNSPIKAVASILQYSFKNELKHDNYKKIEKISHREYKSDRNNKSRNQRRRSFKGRKSNSSGKPRFNKKFKR